MKTSLKCQCGRRILQRDVMRQRYYERQFGPSYIYLRYRCSNCKKLGEMFVRQDEWSDNLLSEVTFDSSEPERLAFQTLGPITITEMRDFHHALEDLGSIPRLIKEE